MSTSIIAMQQMMLTVRPTIDFEVPNSTGYQLYSALLAVMRSSNPGASGRVHDSEIGAIAVSGLSGTFGRAAKRPVNKMLYSRRTYQFHIGITDPDEIEVFQSLIQPLILEGMDINLEAGALRIEEVTSSTLTFEELMVAVSRYDGEVVEFVFMSPACIQYGNSSVTEMFPHRTAVFNSLLSKWNHACPEELKMNVERDEFARYLAEKPDAKSYDTHSVMVNTAYDSKRGHSRPIFRQGFTGRCAYRFVRDAPQDVRNAVVALAMFAEYSGVGSSVGRGCGWVWAKMGAEVREVGR
ncbi:MAG: CRISPR-associated protein Cas6 [Candidatus Methanogaster sp.]|uniref:CRISPR-associated protein Cas6 n=1 Tax=Candidatus Methanogaster sp. TaxID=3386292 RepID=A0AC61KZD6_9EURY|nr:MAG: CRISPR-associated protein Cas6 [ANME-2 cluster archaeon]